MAVLRYIRNGMTRLHTFVANRIAYIRDGSDVTQWKYVNTRLNPADDVSRGLHSGDSLSSATWINGPEFLREAETSWPEQPQLKILTKDDPELKTTKESNLIVENDRQEFMDKLLSYFSDWMKVKKTVAWMLVAKRKLMSWVIQRKQLQKQLELVVPDSYGRNQDVDKRMKILKEISTTNHEQHLLTLSVPMLQEAELIICKFEQQRYFHDEIYNITAINPRTTRQKNKQLLKLDPMMENGILRLGGRLERATIPYESKHQIILPTDSAVSKLIL